MFGETNIEIFPNQVNLQAVALCMVDEDRWRIEAHRPMSRRAQV